MSIQPLNAEPDRDSIGIFMLPSSFPYPDMLAGVAAGMATSALGMRISRLPDEEEIDADGFLQSLRLQRIRGLVISQYNVSTALLDFLLTKGIPHVFVNGNPNPCSIVAKEYEAARDITDRMLAHASGRRFAYLDATAVGKHISVEGRRKGFQDAVAAQGGHPVVIDTSQPHETLLETLAAQSFDGVLCYNADVFEQIAHANVLSGCVTGCWVGDHVLESVPPEVTYYLRLPLFEMGKQAVEELLKAIAQPGHAIPEITIPYAPARMPGGKEGAETS